MAISEFELIARFFGRPGAERAEVVVGIGDDAAVLEVPPDRMVLVDVSHFAVERHFAADDPPASVAHRALGGALARVAARGAEPFAFTLALTLPNVDEPWLEAFSAALAALALRQRVALIGGDTTRGALSLTLNLQGLIHPGELVPARGAAPGDLLFVAGPLGGPALALLDRLGELRLPKAERDAAYHTLHFPEPEPDLGRALAGLASAAGALDDGLCAGIEALLGGTGAGASVHLEQLPVDPVLRPRLHQAGGWNLLRDGPAPAQVCFALPASHQEQLAARLQHTSIRAAWIGTVERAGGVRFLLPDGSAL